MLSFSALYNDKMTSKIAAITGWGSHGFCYDTLGGKNNGVLFFVMVMFLSLFW